ncbi:MAG: hypothetical protein AAFX93_16090 [Verrucomicrobiota bacterium]
MTLRLAAISLLFAVTSLSLSAESVFPAYHVYSMTGKLGTNNRFGAVDHAHFEAGDVLTSTGINWVQRSTLTCKGIAIFDLQSNGLGQAIKAAEGKKLLLSFALEGVKGEPRPLRVEYIGTTGELDSKRSLTAQFERSPIHQANRVLDLHSEPGIKVIDASSLFERNMPNRYLIIRFEQEGMRRQIHSRDGASVSPDLYVFNNDPASVKITVTNQKAEDAVGTGYANLLPNMPTNLVSDMSPNPIQDMPADPIQDMPADPIQDMSDNLITDMPKNLINDQP